MTLSSWFYDSVIMVLIMTISPSRRLILVHDTCITNCTTVVVHGHQAALGGVASVL